MTKYTDFVKALAAERGVTYKEAMAEAKGLYKESKNKKEVESPKSVVEEVKEPEVAPVIEPLQFDPIIHIILDALPGSGVVLKKTRKIRAKSISVA